MDTITRVLALAGIVIAFIVMRDRCRSCIAHSRKPSPWLMPGTSALASLLMLLVLYGTDIFGRRFWDDDTMPVLAVIAFVLCFVISLIPSVAVVAFYRGRER